MSEAIKQPHTISESIRQEGVKGFMKRWKDGLNKIPQDKLIQTELIGMWASMIATIFAGVIFMIWSKMWPISIVLLVGLILQVSQLIQKYQQYNQVKMMLEAFK
jgi:hypothetical protein